MDWLQKISITCFAASYGVVFALEASRIFFQTKLRTILRLGLTAAGLFAHTVYIVYHTQSTVGSDGIWLGSWLGWGLAVAWVLAASYLWLTVQKPKSLIGLFLLPVTLLLILVSTSFGDAGSFSPGRAKTIWNLIHGSALLLGTVNVALGFVFSVMYLINARRLKLKLAGWFKLPSLEWLQRLAERSLAISTLLFGCGLASGIALVMVKQSTQVGTPSIPWSDPVIWSSAILFLWLLATTIFSVVYKPARQGKKIACLVTVSFMFLLVELMIVLQFGHGTPKEEIVFNKPVPRFGITLHKTLRTPPLPENSDRKDWPFDQTVSKFLGRGGRGVRGLMLDLRAVAQNRHVEITEGQHEEYSKTTSMAPHPPTPSPREFGLRLIPMAKLLGPNSRGEGEQEILWRSNHKSWRYRLPSAWCSSGEAREYPLACASGLYCGPSLNSIISLGSGSRQDFWNCGGAL